MATLVGQSKNVKRAYYGHITCQIVSSCIVNLSKVRVKPVPLIRTFENKEFAQSGHLVKVPTYCTTQMQHNTHLHMCNYSRSKTPLISERNTCFNCDSSLLQSWDEDLQSKQVPRQLFSKVFDGMIVTLCLGSTIACKLDMENQDTLIIILINMF